MKHLLHTLYITEENATLGLEEENLAIRYSDGAVDRIPLILLHGIVSFSNLPASPALMAFCAEHGIGLSFFSQGGRFRYRVNGPTRGNVLLRKRQYIASEDESMCRMLAADIIDSKLAAECKVLSRFVRNHPECNSACLLQAIADISDIRKRVSEVKSTEQVRGLEGLAARSYFSAFGEMILSPNEAMQFYGRNRRPPKDCCNALLSFLYAMLANDCEQALESTGLDPYVGFLHTDRPGRASLALDLMEELRVMIADRIALRLINLEIVNELSFLRDGEGVFLARSGKQAVLAEWSRQKKHEIEIGEGEKVQQGLLPYLQAEKLARYLRGEESRYTSIGWRI